MQQTDRESFVSCSVSKNQQDLFNILGSLYSAIIFFGINNCSTVLPFVATERTVLYRERFAGMYSPWAYSSAQVQNPSRHLALNI